MRIETPQASPGHYCIIALACSAIKHEQSLSDLRSQTNQALLIMIKMETGCLLCFFSEGRKNDMYLAAEGVWRHRQLRGR